jgi:hypothetical protein
MGFKVCVMTLVKSEGNRSGTSKKATLRLMSVDKNLALLGHAASMGGVLPEACITPPRKEGLRRICMPHRAL